MNTDTHDTEIGRMIHPVAGLILVCFPLKICAHPCNPWFSIAFKDYGHGMAVGEGRGGIKDKHGSGFESGEDTEFA